MSATIVLSCDGHRHGQPCRGFLPTRALAPAAARHDAVTAGWRSILDVAAARFTDLCPAAGHDEDGSP